SNNVFLSNTSKIIFAQPYIIADGFRFANGSVGNNCDCVVRLNSDHCILKNTSIVDYNPPSTSTDNYWIYFDGNYNQVNRCFFTGKNNERP
ncbi:chondroitinase-B domain-containing protein, partial [Salmonella enterica]|uniref:chondroitinase-B domain-containing protein n=1 Tax=Salmonella enterica TaxID=28901 RepID=UPI0020C2153B